MGEDKPIFRVELNEKGAESIRRIYPFVRIIFWGNLVTNLLACFFLIRRLPRLAALRRAFDTHFSIRLLVYPLYILILTVSSFLFYFYFLRFSRKAKESLILNESSSFNESFHWLNRSLSFALIMIGVHAAYLFISNYLYGF